MGLRGVAGALEPALMAERSQDGEARPASSDAKGRMPAASVRATGTGSPEPTREGWPNVRRDGMGNPEPTR